MQQKHTPEPWQYIERGSYGGKQEADLSCEYHEAVRGYMALADAARIVACVNACAGMTDPAAEIEAMRRELASLKKVASDMPMQLQDTDGNWYWIPAHLVADFMRAATEISGMECMDNPDAFDEFSSNWGVYATGGDAKNVPYFYS